MGTVKGLIVVLTFVGLPFYINTVKAGFEEISPRLEHVARSLGASAGATLDLRQGAEVILAFDPAAIHLMALTGSPKPLSGSQ